MKLSPCHAEFHRAGLPDHEDEDPILESYMQAPSMEQKKFSAKAYKLIANKQFKAITKLSFYERGATASSQAGKLYEASTVDLSRTSEMQPWRIQPRKPRHG